MTGLGLILQRTVEEIQYLGIDRVSVILAPLGGLAAGEAIIAQYSGKQRIRGLVIEGQEPGMIATTLIQLVNQMEGANAWKVSPPDDHGVIWLDRNSLNKGDSDQPTDGCKSEDVSHRVAIESGQSRIEQSDSLLPRILIVEDDPDQREILALVFVSSGYEVREAKQGVEALTLLQSNGPFDLVITDLMMPVMGGLELLIAIRGEPALSKTPVLVLTVQSEGGKEYELLEAGADDYCFKSVDRKVLLSRVGKLIGGRQGFLGRE